MLIKNIEVVDRVKQFKYNIYWLVRQITNSMKFDTVGLIHIFIIHIIISFFFVSVLFKAQDFFPSSISQIFRIFLLTNLSATFSVDPTIIYAAVLSVNLIILILTAFHCIFASVFAILTRILSLTIKLSHYFIVPLLDLAVSGYLVMVDPGSDLNSSILGGVTAFTTVVPVIALLVQIKFEIRMLRKKVTLWNLDNDVHFYGSVFLVFKTIVVAFSGATIPLCLLSIGVWYYHRQFVGGCVGAGEKVMEYSFYNYVVAADVGVLVSLLGGSQMLAFSVWVVLMGCFVFNCMLSIYRQKMDKLCLPRCGSGPEEFYHFYYRFKQEFKGEDVHSNSGSRGKYEKIFYLHRIACDKNTCQLGILGEECEMEDLIARFIQAKKNVSIDNRLVYELWNLELGRKCSVQAIADKPTNLKQDFICYAIDKMTKDSEVTIKNSESNKNVISKVFYDLIYEISTYYSQFYEQLARTHPKIDAIVRLGTAIKSKIGKLKLAYSQLLKSKLINFKMIELYMQFLTNFVSENALDKDDINRLMKAQQNIYFEDISQNYLPTLALYLQTGSIENANAEAQKFLHSTRFQLKYKNISDITLPCLSVQRMKEILTREVVDMKDDPIYSFFRKSQKEYGFGSIIFNERAVRQKKLMVVQIMQEIYSDQKNLFLVSNEFDLKLMLRKTVKIKSGGFRTAPLTLNWEQVFATYILANKEKILSSKMVKIPIDIKQCVLVVKRLRCVDEEFFILQAQMFVSSELTRRNRSSIMTFRKSLQNIKFRGNFQFHIGEDEQHQKLTFYGLRGDPFEKISNCKPKTLNQFQKTIQMQLVEGILGSAQRQYSRDIKTYRLFDGQLYNVDLQDKQAYNSLFEQHISESKQIEASDNSSFQCYIFIGVVLLGFGLIGLSVALIVQFQTSAQSISTLYTQFINIQSLKIDFHRISSLLRDLASGFSAGFPQVSVPNEIGDSYGRIQNLKSEVLFTNTEYTINFQNLVITGTLVQLVDVMLAHITQVLSDGDLSIIEDIHDTCINQLNEMIQGSQSGIYGSIVSQIGSVTLLSNVVLYASLGIVALLYFLMALYCLRSNTQLKDNLAHLLYISDSEAHMNQENAEKMKYAVEMIRKNFQIDTQNLLITDTDFKRRKNPKEAIQSKEIFYTIAIMALVVLAVHITCLFFFSSQFDSQLANFRTMKDEALSTTTVYHTSAQLTTYIEHVGSIDYGMLGQIRGNLSYLQYQMSNFQFSPTLNNFIGTLFFDDSCAMIESSFNITTAMCSASTPGFTITNPFQVGLALYINRQNYYFFNNLTEDFAHTGVYSRPFAEILTNLTEYIKTDSLNAVGQIAGLVNLMNGLIIAIDCGYILAFVIIYYYFRNQLYRIKEIIIFFNEKLKARKPNSEQKEEENAKYSSQSDEVSEEEQVPLDAVKSKRKNRTTIQQNQMLLTG